MLTAEQIRTFIEADKASPRKQQAQVGDRYYNAQHDILKKRIFFINADGQLQEDPTKSNIKKPHAFFRENVDQTVQYLMSSDEAIIRSDDPDLQNELDERFNDNEAFQMELREMLTGVCAKGFEYAYTYKDVNGKSTFECADSLGVVEVRKHETEDNCEYIIYWFVDRIDKDGRSIKKIQVWDEHQVHFFCQIDDGDITEDDSEEINPRPHVVYKSTKEGDGKRYHHGGYGFIPFRRFDNNRCQASDLQAIKPLIDDYDLMSCGLANNIEDMSEALYVVTGFEGDNLDELMLNIKAKKHVGVGEGGDVKIETVNIPVEARKTMMEIDEQNIYRFGMALNLHALKDTSATTNIAIKSAYSLLDLKTEKLKPRLKAFLRWQIGLALEEINQESGTDYTQKDVYFVFKPEIPTNAQENAQIELTEAQARQTEINTVLNIAAQLDSDTVLELICEQLDIDVNEIRDKLPKEEPGTDPAQAQAILQNLPTEEVMDNAE